MTVPAFHVEAKLHAFVPLTPFDRPPIDAEWRVIPYAADYEVSEFGHVRRRTVGRSPQAKAGLILKPRMNEGYARFGLWSDGAQTHYHAHRLVADVFICPRPPGKQVAHKDGNRLNNHYSNLRWATSAENSQDRDDHGRTSRGARHSAAVLPNRPRGEKVKGAKLTADNVRYILESLESGPTLGIRFGVTRKTINAIRSGKSWRHVP